MSLTDTEPMPSSGPLLWVERGFSRAEICTRMQRVVPGMSILCAPTQVIEGAQPLAFPALTSYDPVTEINELIVQHQVDAIWPQASAALDLSAVKAEVHAAAEPEVMALVDDKARFTDWLGSDDVFVAETTEAVGVDEVSAEYQRRRQEGRQTCVKPAVGVYGHGYWKLSSEDGVKSLLNTPEKHVIDPSIYLAALAVDEARSGPSRIVMMDWLPGPEMSVDVLCWRGSPLVHAARTKLSSSRQLIEAEHPVVSHAYTVAERLALHGIINVQYRLDAAEQWKILEINPRPAGGSINSEDAGFGIITGWARLIANDVEPYQVSQHQGKVQLDVKRTPVLSDIS